jgi:DNA-directed RNA polymerase I, II, and III subunit RPABC2
MSSIDENSIINDSELSDDDKSLVSTPDDDDDTISKLANLENEDDDTYVSDDDNTIDDNMSSTNPDQIATDNIDMYSDTDDDYDDDDDDDDDVHHINYLQKFKHEIQNDFINTFHSDNSTHNYDEINTMSKVIRDNFNNIIDPFHKTIPILTKYERARILGQRAKQIDSGAKSFVHIDKTINDGYLIATRELEEKKIPFIIRRPLPNGGSEYWKVQDLEII